MKTATVRDLRQRFNDVVKWIETGEEISVTRRGIAVATLGPPKSDAPSAAVDWASRLRNRTPVKSKAPLTAEETAAFNESLRRDF